MACEPYSLKLNQKSSGTIQNFKNLKVFRYLSTCMPYKLKEFKKSSGTSRPACLTNLKNLNKSLQVPLDLHALKFERI